MRSRDRCSTALIQLVLAGALAACGRHTATSSAASRDGSGASDTPGGAASGAGGQRASVTAPPPTPATPGATDLDASQAEPLRRSFAAYRALTSYADTGTATDESPGVTSYGAFTTYFRKKTVDFYFDYTSLYQEDSSKRRLNFQDKRYVWWMRNGNLETYTFEGKDHKILPPTANQAASLNTVSTKGASMLIPSLLFRKANLPSALLAIEESADAGMEMVDGHPCHKVIGVAAEVYPSGRRTGVRQVTVWIDRDTLLIRKVFQDTPKGYAGNLFYRVTITLQPQANPGLDDTKFVFQVPDPQQR